MIFCWININIVSAANTIDTSPPQIIDWQLVPQSSMDNRFNSVIFQAKFILSDDSVIQSPKLRLKNFKTGNLTEVANVVAINSSGKLTEFSANATVSIGSPGGIWAWQIDSLRDAVGNQYIGSLIDSKWKSEVTVLNCEYTPYDSQVEILQKRVVLLNQQIKDTLNNLKNFAVKYPENTELNLLLLRAPSEISIQFKPKPANCDLAFLPGMPILDSNLVNFQDQESKIASFTVQANTFLVGLKAQELSSVSVVTFIIKLKNLIHELRLLIPKIKSPSDIKEAKGLLSVAEQYLTEIPSKPALANQSTINNLQIKYDKLSSKTIKSVSINCIKGKLIKVVKGSNPKCPSGYTKSN